MSVRRSKQSGPKRAPLSQRKLAQPVFKQATLRDIQLLSCNARHSFEASPPQGSTFVVQLNVNGHAIVNPKEKALLVKTTFRIVGHFADVEDQKLEIEVLFGLLYDLESTEGLAVANYDAFTRWIGMNNAWPYAREFVHETTARMGLQPLKLPLYRPEILEGHLAP